MNRDLRHNICMKRASRTIKKTVKDGKIIKRTADGKIAKGSAPLNPSGKKKGTLNKFTTLKQVFLDAFERLGGVDRLVEWAEGDPANEKVFYTLLARMLPREVSVSESEEVKPGNMRGLKDSELDDLLKRHLSHI